ncbi:hypothetical protein KM427_10270 [Nocardioides sp. LMS-CY]|uniref:hypothetical protein n=1 Tax=Nocardioides sp. (strain LMS-CY) TaxID=2840457 RepID=UPI001C000885|nr:hypothetical protein [Nocardioides sp. LMS-CY]QWF24033.1 hypothetical protein KM427_10270 [Nocardioides sp. LMS-CY]
MPAASRLSRRAALAVGVGGLLGVSGCGQDAPAPLRPAAAGDPDEALVDEAVARITATAAKSGRVPQLTAMHAAHLAALEAEAPVAAAASRRQLRRAERDLQEFLEDAAVRAESGPLARLLASMSASVSQHLAALPSEAT